MKNAQENQFLAEAYVTGKASFQYNLLNRVFQYCYQFEHGNRDYLRFPTAQSRGVVRYLKDCVKGFLAKHGYASPQFAREKAAEQLASVLALADNYEVVFHQLADDFSRQWLIDLICLRVLGPAHVKLLVNNRDYWDQYRSINKRYLVKTKTAQVSMWNLNRYQVPGKLGPLTLDIHPLNLLDTFLLEQYAYHRSSPPIRAEPGDTVLDAGGCFGDTALYFADRVGAAGKVLTCEPDPDNLAVLRQNLNLNPTHRAQVEVIQEPVWDVPGVLIDLNQNGPGSRIDVATRAHAHDKTVATVTLDQIVNKRRLPRIDFIKMDIEGAELRALQGAEHTLRRHKPKLAISIYHQEHDYLTIPVYLHRLGLNYRFFIDHFTTHSEETVLFAVADEGVAGVSQTRSPRSAFCHYGEPDDQD